MIAKRVARNGKISNYRELARYILDQKGMGEKVREAWSTGCATADDFDLSIAEISATQALNTRSKNDKTYHLVVSLSSGENLSEDQWKEVEQRLCETIGLGGHQRICAVHKDTDYVHMHIALSKVHPKNFNCIEPFYDKFKLHAACRELEAKFDLKPLPAMSPVRERAPSEIHQGLESFSSYIKTNLTEKLAQLLNEPGKNWQDAQSLAGSLGLEIRERGAGLVFSHLEKNLFVKASSVDPRFSKKSLEAAFGKFKTSLWKGKPEKVFATGPLESNSKKSELYASYRENVEIQRKSRIKELSNVSDLQYRKLQDIKDRYAKRRGEIRRDTMIAKGRKRSIYQKLTLEMRKEISMVYSQAKSDRLEIRERLKSTSWTDWTHERASRGDETALEVLRRKLTQGEPEIGAIIGEHRNHVILSGLPRRVDRDGSVEYQAGEGSFVDRGEAIVLNSLSPATVKAALLAAAAKFGDQIKFKGSEDFMQAIEHYAKDLKKERNRPFAAKEKDKNLGRSP